MSLEKRSILATSADPTGIVLELATNTTLFWPSTIAQQNTGKDAPVEWEMFFYHSAAAGAVDYWNSFGFTEAAEPGLRVYSTLAGGSFTDFNFRVVYNDGTQQLVTIPSVFVTPNQWYHVIAKVVRDGVSSYSLQVSVGRSGEGVGQPDLPQENFPYPNTQTVFLPGVNDTSGFRDKSLRCFGHPFRFGQHTIRVGANLVGGVAVMRAWNVRRGVAQTNSNAHGFLLSNQDLKDCTHIFRFNEDATPFTGATAAQLFLDEGVNKARWTGASGFLTSYVEANPFGIDSEVFARPGVDQPKPTEQIGLKVTYDLTPNDNPKPFEVRFGSTLFGEIPVQEFLKPSEGIALVATYDLTPSDNPSILEQKPTLHFAVQHYSVTFDEMPRMTEAAPTSIGYATLPTVDGPDITEGISTLLIFTRAAVSDNPAITETIAPTQVQSVVVSDNPAITEDPAPVQVLLLTASDNPGGGEAVGASLGGVFSLVGEDEPEATETIVLAVTRFPYIYIIDEELVILKEGDGVTVVAIWNIAMTSLGISVLASTSDQSPQATLLNSVWEAFRQQWLTQNPWNGAKTTQSLTKFLNDTATNVDPEGKRWTYAYLLPDSTDSRPYLHAQTINGRELKPDQRDYEIEIVENDIGTLKRCLLSDEATVDLEYLFDVTDTNISLLAASTTYAMGLGLAAYIAPHFGKSAQEQTALRKRAEDAIIEAKAVDGQEGTYRRFQDNPLLDARR